MLWAQLMAGQGSWARRFLNPLGTTHTFLGHQVCWLHTAHVEGNRALGPTLPVSPRRHCAGPTKAAVCAKRQVLARKKIPLSPSTLVLQETGSEPNS